MIFFLVLMVLVFVAQIAEPHQSAQVGNQCDEIVVQLFFLGGATKLFV